ncbi:MAG: ribonuclease HII [Algibacter sp.]
MEAYQALEKELELLSNLKATGDILICLDKNKMDSLNFTIVTKHHNNLFITDSLKDYTEETFTEKNKFYKKSTLKNTFFYSTIIDSLFIASSLKQNIVDAFNSPELNTSLEKSYRTLSEDKELSIIIKSGNPFIESFFADKHLPLKAFTNYIAFDADINQDQLFFNGVTKASDSTKSFINVFKNTVPQENQIQNITPSNSDGFLSFTFNDYSIFKQNLNNHLQKDSIANQTLLFENANEIGVIYEAKNRAIILNSIDAIATNEALIGEQTLIENYRQVDIFNFSKPELFSTELSPLITYTKASKYCQIDHFFVFTDDLEMLQNIIANYQNKTTLSEQIHFKNIKEQLSDEASLMLVTNPSNLKNILNENLEESISNSFKDYKSSAIQFIYDSNFAHVNGIIKKAKRKASANTVSEELNIKLESDLLNYPQFVVNHITKQKEIVVQDVNNNFYLISNKGKVLWKKRIKGAILGKINQIDMYKNGRLQLAFATPNYVYVLDRNGKEVSPFPLKFNDIITQPLSVFDYDKKKNYRLLVTQNKKVLMYDGKGKSVNGFTFKQANNSIITSPQHFRIGSKDYITVKTKDKLYILDRIGKTRVTPKTTVNFSAEALYLYKNKFTTTTNDGQLITIDTKGNTASQNLKLSEKHHITTTSKTLVTYSEDKLNIRNKTVNLDFGNYSEPKIFYINDKIYVSITDLQSRKVHLYDSQTKPLPNFPVYGNSIMTLDNIDKDAALEFVTKGENNAILLYQIN